MDKADSDRKGDILKQPSEPRYQTLAQSLATLIVTGGWPAGSRIPQERDLVADYHLSRFTVRSALQVLEKQGMIQRVRGKGTFVTSGATSKRRFSTAAEIEFLYSGGTSIPEGFYTEILTGATQMARALGLGLQIRHIRGYVKVPLQEYQPPRAEQIRGVIVCSVFDEQYLKMFASEGVPVVSVDMWSHTPQIDSVVVDVESEAYLAIEHLADREHTSVGFIATGRKERGGEFYEYDPDIWRLLDTLRRASQQRQIEMREDWIRLIPRSGPQVYDTIHEMLSRRSLPTSLICFDGSVAIPALRAMHDLGIRCPEDMSLISRGGTVVAGRPLTTLAVDPELLGRMAVKLLVERIQGQRDTALKVAVTGHLVLGQTTGYAPRK